MPNCKTSVPFAGTAEQEERLRAVIAEHAGEDGPLMPVLHAAQEIYGYLPEEALIIIAEALDIPLAEIYGVATFYTRFTLDPKGEHQVSVCLGTACYVKGSADVLARVEEILGIKAGELTADGKFSLDATRCVGACGLSPIMLVDDDVYGHMTPERVEGILKKYE